MGKASDYPVVVPGEENTVYGNQDGDFVQFPLSDILNDTSMSIGLFTSIPGLTIPTESNLIQTSGYSMKGKGAALYIADILVDAAFVIANPKWSVMTANGRGFKLYEEQYLTIEMFGAAGDADYFITGTDDWPAFRAAFDYQERYDYSSGGNTDYKPAPVIHFKNRGYRSSEQWILDRAGYQLVGTGNNQNGQGGSFIFVDAGRGGVILQSWDNDGISLKGNYAPHPYGTEPRGASGFLLQDITFQSRGGTLGNDEQNGVLVHTSGTVRRVYGREFGGNGIAVVSSNQDGSNANLTIVEDCGGEENGLNGYYDEGQDVNAGRVVGFNAINNRKFGMCSAAFLGKAYRDFHLDGNGNVGCGPVWDTSSKGTAVDYPDHTGSSFHYRVIPGQSVGARTNPPTGFATSNTWWLYRGTATGYPIWTSGHAYVEGGSYFVGLEDFAQNNNTRSTFSGYAESNQQGGYCASTTACTLPGFAVFQDGGANMAIIGEMFAMSKFGIKKPGVTSGHTVSVTFGDLTNTFENNFLSLGNSTSGATAWTWHINDSNQIYNNYNGSGAGNALSLFPPGDSVGVGIAFNRGVKIQNIRIYSGTAAPTTGAWVVSDIVWNQSPSAGGTPGWVCTTSGTPGTWKAMANLAA